MPAHNAATENVLPLIDNSLRSPLPVLFTYADVASALKVSVQTVECWVKQGRIPSPRYIGVTARFTREHLDAIYTGVKKPHTYPVTDSPRAATARAAKTRAKAAKLKIARTLPRRTPAAGVKGKGGAK